jgi:hypothetical protein
MANPWFRLYSEFDADPKVQSMPEPMQRRLIMFFCETCRDETVTMCDEDRAFHWRVSLDELSETKALFVRKGFCDDTWKAVNWEKRQTPADSSKERTKRWRDKHRSKGVTAGDSHGDVTTTLCDGLEQNRTEQIRADKKKSSPPAAVELPEWMPSSAWDAYVRYRKKGKAPFTEDAVRVTIRDLTKLQSAGQDIRAVLEQSIQRGWTGVFPIKQEDGNGKGNNTNNGRTNQIKQDLASALARMGSKEARENPAALHDGQV